MTAQTPARSATPSLGREPPLTLHRSLSSFQGVQATPEKHSPNLHPQTSDTCYKNYICEGDFLCTWNWGENPSFERHLKPQQGILLWVKRNAYVLRDVSVYSSYNTSSFKRTICFSSPSPPHPVWLHQHYISFMAGITTAVWKLTATAWVEIVD